MKIIKSKTTVEKMTPIKAEAIFTHRRKISDFVYELDFEMSSPDSLNFKAGQYIAIIINPTTRRQYSISTSPLYSRKFFQIILDIKPNGLGVNFLMALKPGDAINFIGQIGLFTLPVNLKQNLYFVSTGTGIGPLKSMMEELILSGRCLTNNIYSIFGTRYESDIFYNDIFLKYKVEGKIKDHSIFLSRQSESSSIHSNGYVTEFVKANEFNMEESQFFICGSGQMISDVENLLINKGIRSADIFYEKFY